MAAADGAFGSFGPFGVGAKGPEKLFVEKGRGGFGGGGGGFRGGFGRGGFGGVGGRFGFRSPWIGPGMAPFFPAIGVYPLLFDTPSGRNQLTHYGGIVYEDDNIVEFKNGIQMSKINGMYSITFKTCQYFFFYFRKNCLCALIVCCVFNNNLK